MHAFLFLISVPIILSSCDFNYERSSTENKSINTNISNSCLQKALNFINGVEVLLGEEALRLKYKDEEVDVRFISENKVDYSINVQIELDAFITKDLSATVKKLTGNIVTRCASDV